MNEKNLNVDTSTAEEQSLKEQLQQEFDGAISRIGRELSYFEAFVIYKQAKEKGIALVLTPEALQIIKNDYKEQVKGELDGSTHSLGWEGSPQQMESFVKGDAVLEKVLLEGIIEMCPNGDINQASKDLKRYINEQGLNL